MLSISPLKAALVLKVTFIESLPIASRPFLTPLAESALREFAAFFYADEKAKETKSDPSYVPSSAKKLGIVLQAMPEVQESQGFKTLRNGLTADLEKFRIFITKEYIIKANDLNVAAKKMRYHVAVCKWMRGLAQAFTAQQGVNNYSEVVAIIDLIAKHRDDILVPLGMTTKTFLAAYKAANNLQVIPSPTINFDFQELLDEINGTPPGENPVAAPNDNNPNAGAIVIIGRANNLGEFDLDGENDDDEMIDAANAASQPMEGIGGRTAICGLIKNAIFKGTIEPIQKFHKQRNENDEAKRIKAAFTSPRLSDAAQRVASIIANKPAAQMPVLRGLVNETTSKSTSALERRIQSLEIS